MHYWRPAILPSGHEVWLKFRSGIALALDPGNGGAVPPTPLKKFERLLYEARLLPVKPVDRERRCGGYRLFLNG